MSLMVRTSSVVLAGPGAGHQIETENPSFKEEGTIARGQPVVVGEDVSLDTDQPLRLDVACLTNRGVFVQGVMAMRMVMPFTVMIVRMLRSASVSLVTCGVRPGGGGAASADGTHQATSRSLMRISSPRTIGMR